MALEDEPHCGRVRVICGDVEHAGEDGLFALRWELHRYLGNIPHPSQLAEALVHRSTHHHDPLLPVELQELVVVVSEGFGMLTRSLGQLWRMAQQVVLYRPRPLLHLYAQGPVELVHHVDGGQVDLPGHRIHHEVIGEVWRLERLLDVQRAGAPARLQSQDAEEQDGYLHRRRHSSF